MPHFGCHYLDARDQKFKKNEGKTKNQLTKAIAVEVSNLVQWFSAQLLKSLLIRTVIPADAQAAANVSCGCKSHFQTEKTKIKFFWV